MNVIADNNPRLALLFQHFVHEDGDACTKLTDVMGPLEVSQGVIVVTHFLEAMRAFLGEYPQVLALLDRTMEKGRAERAS